MTAADRVDDLRTRRMARAEDRAAFEERRRHGLATRHAAKLAHLAARAKEKPAPLPTTTELPQPDPAPEPDAA